MPTSTSYDEQEILKQVAGGSEQAFTKLFNTWQPFLATHIYRITESSVITEEIVQDVFLKIWQTKETLAGIRHFKAYLLVVSKNHALNVLQKMARELVLQEQYVKANSTQEEDDNQQLYYSLIDEAVDQLSPRQKEIFILARHQKQSYLQIAAQLGIGKESVKTHLTLAIKHISQHVKSRMAVMCLFLLS